MKKISIYDEGKKIHTLIDEDQQKLKKKFNDFFDEKF